MADHRAPDLLHDERGNHVRAQSAPDLPWGDEIDPAPVSLPPTPSGNLPRRRRFVGRTPDMRAIDEALAATRVGLATLVGLAGSGKTALALEYAHRATSLHAYDGGVWWLAADGSPQDALARLAPSLHTLGSQATRAALAALPQGASVAEIATAVRLALQSRRGTALLVLDGIDAAGWRPHLPGGEVRILATTRDDRLALGARVAVRSLLLGDARDLAIAIAGTPASDAEERALGRVLAALGGLAAAVEAAASAVSRWARSWAEYERYMYAEARALLEERDPQGDYADSVLGAVDRSIDACPRGTWARRLLEGAAVFAPRSVPIPWATSAAGGDSTSLETKRALAMLRGLALVEVDDDAQTLSIQELVHRRVRERTEADDLLDHERRGAACVMAWLEEAVDPSRPGEVEARRAHVDEALAAAERSGSDLVWLNVAERFASHLRHVAAYPEARSLLERAVIRAERLDPSDPVRLAESLTSLAALLRDLGEPGEARAHLERALGIDEQVFGPKHPAVARDLANLASTLKELGDAARARPLLERALAVDEEVNGREHPNTAKTLAALAAVLKDLGHVAEARARLERALAIEEKAFGPDHPSAVVRMTNLAMLLKDMGQPHEALPLLQRALGILEPTYGPEHPIVATSLTNLALVLKDVGRSLEAMPLLRRAHAIAESTLPPSHPTRVKIAAHLAHTAPPPAPPSVRRG